MFNKKCARCGRKISKDFEFCPYCGNDFRIERRIENQKDYGFLGKDDFLGDFNELNNFNTNMPINLGGIFNSKLFSSLFKEVDKQFKEMDRKIKPEGTKESGISISISMSGDKPDIKVRRFGDAKNLEIKDLKEKHMPRQEITDEQARKLAKLPRKEAKTEVRRFSNKIVYEINLPGIKNLKDVIINKLENSIEIKAFSKENAYFKLLPVNLPIINYQLDKEKLILELGTR